MGESRAIMMDARRTARHGERDACPGVCALVGTVVACAALGAIGCTRPSLLANSGVTGAQETSLGWFLLLISMIVVLVVTVLVLLAAGRRRPQHPGVGLESTPVLVPDEALRAAENRWLVWLGIIVPVVVLTAAFAVTVTTINAVGAPDRPYAATIQVTGHQWWWEVTYQESTHPANTFTTANEIHIPVGGPVRVELRTADVIHSFWVPELAGKMDIIPGQQNSMWLEARQAGVYSGPCGEYCGTQHAHMQMTVVAQDPASYRAWLAGQRQSAAAPTDSAHAAGRTEFMVAGCGTCHTIRGTEAGGAVGPDLTHLASRRAIGAGAVANSPGNLMGWISDAQGIKPGNDMPRMALTPTRLESLVAYLETLR